MIRFPQQGTKQGRLENIQHDKFHFHAVRCAVIRGAHAVSRKQHSDAFWELGLGDIVWCGFLSLLEKHSRDFTLGEGVFCFLTWVVLKLWPPLCRLEHVLSKTCFRARHPVPARPFCGIFVKRKSGKMNVHWYLAAFWSVQNDWPNWRLASKNGWKGDLWLMPLCENSSVAGSTERLLSKAFSFKKPWQNWQSL